MRECPSPRKRSLLIFHTASALLGVPVPHFHGGSGICVTTALPCCPCSLSEPPAVDPRALGVCLCSGFTHSHSLFQAARCRPQGGEGIKEQPLNSYKILLFVPSNQCSDNSTASSFHPVPKEPPNSPGTEVFPAPQPAGQCLAVLPGMGCSPFSRAEQSLVPPRELCQPSGRSCWRWAAPKAGLELSAITHNVLFY